jgi:hypothetical protein
LVLILWYHLGVVNNSPWLGLYLKDWRSKGMAQHRTRFIDETGIELAAYDTPGLFSLERGEVLELPGQKGLVEVLAAWKSFDRFPDGITHTVQVRKL